MGRKKNVAIAADEYSFLQDDVADTTPQPAAEKHKPRKGSKAAVPDDDDYEPPLPLRGDEEPMNIILTSKKSGGAVSSFSAFNALMANEDQDNAAELSDDGCGDDPVVHNVSTPQAADEGTCRVHLRFHHG